MVWPFWGLADTLVQALTMILVRGGTAMKYSKPKMKKHAELKSVTFSSH